MGDIDNFKKINDLFGHQIGDEILKTFARVLTDNVHTRDTVARYGGEEFAIIRRKRGGQSAQAADRAPCAARSRAWSWPSARADGRSARSRRPSARRARSRRRRGADPARRRQALRGQVRRPQPRCRGPGRRRVTRLTPWSRSPLAGSTCLRSQTRFSRSLLSRRRRQAGNGERAVRAGRSRSSDIRRNAMNTHALETIRPFLTKNTFLGRLPDVVLDALVRKGRSRAMREGPSSIGEETLATARWW